MEEKTAPSQPTVPASTPPAATLSAKKQKSKIMLFSLIGVGVVILLGIIFFVFKNTHSATQAPNKTQTVDITNIPLHEAPQLAEKVKAGTLPPVRDRLPKTPMLINPVERVGEYGGTWRMAGLKTNDHSIMYRSMGYENLVRWNDTWTGVIPNVAQAYDVNSDGAEYTFKLREGMKWSDGQPFTADDVMFWYNDILSNKNLTPSPAKTWRSNGQLVKVEKIDMYTVKFTFATTSSLFLKTVSQVVGAEPTSYPAHYLKQFLTKYNSQVPQMIAAAGSKSEKEFFESKFGTIGTPDNANRWQHPEVPTLNAWILTSAYASGPDVMAERNPYYWKIDPAGNQLPYIDQLDYQMVDKKPEILTLATSGKIDMQDRNLGNGGLISAQNRGILEKNAKAQGYHFFQTILSFMNNTVISLNITHKDPIMRQILGNKDFRIGLSYAINRPQIIKDVYLGNGTPYQVAPRPETPFYNEKLAKQYTEYDIAKANQYLDKAGLTKKDTESYRLRPDGKRVSITLDWGNADVSKHLQDEWKAVGIEMNIGNLTDRTALYAAKSHNLHDAVVWDGDGGSDPLLEPRAYFPYSAESNYAIPWAYWYADKTNLVAEEPPAYVKEQQHLYDQIIATTDEQKQNDYMKQILAISADQFYAIGISLPSNGFGIVKDNFHNVPKLMPYAFTFPSEAPTNPCQYFISSK